MNYAAVMPADELKYELIDGTTYMMAPPRMIHINIGGNLFHIIRSYLSGKRCKVFAEAPVIFDDANYFIPDLLVVCDRNKIRPNGIYGAPDLIIEILSPSTQKRDWGIKKDTYEKYGVKEYWLVSPKEKSVTVYILQNGRYELDNVYFDIDQEEWEYMDDKERAAQKFTLKISLYDDFEINVKDIFEE